jgi:hypothetical protein
VFDYADANGKRAVYEPLATEVARQTANAAQLMTGGVAIADIDAGDTSALDWAAHMMQERTDESRAAE